MGRYFKTATLNMFDDFYSDPWKDINAKLVEKQTAFDALSQHKDLLAKQLEQFKVLRDDGIDGELLRRANEYSLNKAQELQDYLIQTGDVDTVTREATNLGKEINGLYTTGDLGAAIQGKIFHDEMLKKNEEMFKGDPGAGDRYKAYWMNEYYKNGGKFSGSTLGGMFELINFPEFKEMEEFAVKVLKESGWNNIRKSDNGELEVETENGWEGVTSKRFQDLIFNRLYNEPKYRRAIEQREMMGMKKEDFLRGYFNMAGYLAYGKDKSKHSTAIGDVAEHREKGKIDLANSKELHEFKKRFDSDPNNLTIQEKLDAISKAQEVYGKDSSEVTNLKNTLFVDPTSQVHGQHKTTLPSIYDLAKGGDVSNMEALVNEANKDLTQKYSQVTGIPVGQIPQSVLVKLGEISRDAFYRNKHENINGYLKVLQKGFDSFVGKEKAGRYKFSEHTPGIAMDTPVDWTGKGGNTLNGWGSLSKKVGSTRDVTEEAQYINLSLGVDTTAKRNINNSPGNFEYFNGKSWITLDEGTQLDSVIGVSIDNKFFRGKINGMEVAVRGNNPMAHQNVINAALQNAPKGSAFSIINSNPRIYQAITDIQDQNLNRSSLEGSSKTPLIGRVEHNNSKIVAFKGTYYVVNNNDIMAGINLGHKGESLGNYIQKVGTPTSDIYEAATTLNEIK